MLERGGPALFLGGEGFVVLPALIEDLSAILIKDDDLEGVRSEELERHHVVDLDLMNGCVGGPTLIQGRHAVCQLHRHLLGAADVVPELELCRHRNEMKEICPRGNNKVIIYFINS